MNPSSVHPVDEMLPTGKLAALASQLRGLPSTIDVSPPVKSEEQPVVTITPEPTVEAAPAPEPKKKAAKGKKDKE